MAKLTKSLRFRTLWRLYSDETLLERLAQDLEHMTATLAPCIQEEGAVVGPRHLTRHRPLAPPISPTSEMV
jgi:hypothetical protein